MLRRLAPLILGLGLLGGCTAIKVSAYEGFGRDRWQRADAVVEALEVRSGDRIADVGAGSGYFTFRLADATGPNGRVYALDVDRGLVRHVSERARKTGTRHVIALRVDPGRPELPEPVDLVFSCDVYHHFPIGSRTSPRCDRGCARAAGWRSSTSTAAASWARPGTTRTPRPCFPRCTGPATGWSPSIASCATNRF